MQHAVPQRSRILQNERSGPVAQFAQEALHAREVSRALSLAYRDQSDRANAHKVTGKFLKNICLGDGECARIVVRLRIVTRDVDPSGCALSQSIHGLRLRRQLWRVGNVLIAGTPKQ